MTELNELTKKLLAEGYTQECYPDYVSGYHEYDGGFTYGYKALCGFVFETPCGLLAEGHHFGNGYMSYNGIDWRAENNNPVICCPRFDRPDCNLRHPLLATEHYNGSNEEIRQCACHLTDREYSYEQSVDKAHDDVWKEADRLFEEFNRQKKGRACRLHSGYSRTEKRWRMNYDPLDCANHNVCSFCKVLQTEVSPQKGNVFYDIKISWMEKGFGLFPDRQIVTMQKGVKLFDHLTSMTICEAVCKYAKHRIQKKEQLRHHSFIWARKNAEVEVLNIRTEYRASRDLLQDLRDAAEGIEIHHVSDDKKAAAQRKKESRNKSRQQRIQRLERLFLTHGWDGLDEIDQRRIEKKLSPERIEELEWQRDNKEEQTNLFALPPTEKQLQGFAQENGE